MNAPYSDPLQMALQRELRRSERVLWQAKPLARVATKAFLIYFFAIPWTAFALFWTVMAMGATSGGWGDAGWLSFAFPLFGLPFILVGLGMLSAPFIPLFAARKTLFAITDERVIRLYLGRRLMTSSLEAGQIGEIERTEGPDGSGTLKITAGSYRDSDGDRMAREFGLGEVENVFKAQETIRDMVSRHRARAISSSASSHS
ncbi:hypothetical protein [Alteraurantiacibacter aestuarii]|uniref:DUF304 domain-containing protein n=1 Tax=Alteraurantiacibacter aestuarii TaxID=650004 RepID=A0A844ZQH1_9SPHN|nr:hypothetical protein [Alteraurantiacibacter aestuarii]MXO89047.1 hypothetical protein [Alteraurantiacibacter aestuarii]